MCHRRRPLQELELVPIEATPAAAAAAGAGAATVPAHDGH